MKSERKNLVSSEELLDMQWENIENNQLQLSEKAYLFPPKMKQFFSKILEPSPNEQIGVETELKRITEIIGGLFNVKVEPAHAKEIAWLIAAIKYNDEFRGYSRHNYTSSGSVLSNIDKLKDNLKDNEEFTRAHQMYLRFKQDNESKGEKGLAEAIKTFQQICQTLQDLRQARHSLRYKQQIMEKFEIPTTLTNVENPTVSHENIPFPGIIRLDIKIETNFTKTKNLIKQVSGNDIPCENIFKIVITDDVECENSVSLLLRDLTTKYGNVSNIKRTEVNPKISKAYHELICALHEYVQDRFAKFSKTKRYQMVSFILAESGILMKEKLFDEVNEALGMLLYNGDYCEYLKQNYPLNKERTR